LLAAGTGFAVAFLPVAAAGCAARVGLADTAGFAAAVLAAGAALAGRLLAAVALTSLTVVDFFVAILDDLSSGSGAADAVRRG
jgi:hypothetical protein